MRPDSRMVVDGNEAAASVAHRVSEVIAIYPITPSDCISTTDGTLPHTFVRRWLDHSSASSPIVEEGVIG